MDFTMINMIVRTERGSVCEEQCLVENVTLELIRYIQILNTFYHLYCTLTLFTHLFLLLNCQFYIFIYSQPGFFCKKDLSSLYLQYWKHWKLQPWILLGLSKGFDGCWHYFRPHLSVVVLMWGHRRERMQAFFTDSPYKVNRWNLYVTYVL